MVESFHNIGPQSGDGSVLKPDGEALGVESAPAVEAAERHVLHRYGATWFQHLVGAGVPPEFGDLDVLPHEVVSLDGRIASDEDFSCPTTIQRHVSPPYTRFRVNDTSSFA